MRGERLPSSLILCQKLITSIQIYTTALKMLIDNSLRNFIQIISELSIICSKINPRNSWSIKYTLSPIFALKKDKSSCMEFYGFKLNADCA